VYFIIIVISSRGRVLRVEKTTADGQFNAPPNGRQSRGIAWLRRSQLTTMYNVIYVYIPAAGTYYRAVTASVSTRVPVIPVTPAWPPPPPPQSATHVLRPGNLTPLDPPPPLFVPASTHTRTHGNSTQPRCTLAVFSYDRTYATPHLTRLRLVLRRKYRTARVTHPRSLSVRSAFRAVSGNSRVENSADGAASKTACRTVVLRTRGDGMYTGNGQKQEWKTVSAAGLVVKSSSLARTAASSSATEPSVCRHDRDDKHSTRFCRV